MAKQSLQRKPAAFCQQVYLASSFFLPQRSRSECPSTAFVGTVLVSLGRLQSQSLEYFCSRIGPALRPSVPSEDQRGYECMEQMLCCRCVFTEGFLCALCTLKHILSAPERKVRETSKFYRLKRKCRKCLCRIRKEAISFSVH